MKKTTLPVLAAAAALIVIPFSHARAADVTPNNYGNSSGPAVPSSAPGATDETGTGPDASTGVTHAQSSGAARNSATLDGNAARQQGATPENYGTVAGPAATRSTPGADDGTGTGPDASSGISHVQSSGAPQRTIPVQGSRPEQIEGGH